MTLRVPSSEYRAAMRRWHERAAAGEEIVVTDRGVPVVRVVAARSAEVRDRLVREGLLRPARARRPAEQIPVIRAPGDSTTDISADRDARR